MAMGEQVREGRWAPTTDRIPPELQALVDYAWQRGIRLVAYVYPVLAFAESEEWLFEQDGRLWASLANVPFQNWLTDALIAFANQTHGGGFAWDYTYAWQSVLFLTSTDTLRIRARETSIHNGAAGCVSSETCARLSPTLSWYCCTIFDSQLFASYSLCCLFETFFFLTAPRTIGS